MLENSKMMRVQLKGKKTIASENLTNGDKCASIITEALLPPEYCFGRCAMDLYALFGVWQVDF